MIAIIFLAVLACPASGSGPNYSWTGSKSQDPETPIEHVCVTDTSNCGCCLMLRQVHRMEEFFNMSLTALQTRLLETTNVLNNIRGSRSAFSVALTNKRSCLGPFPANQTVHYTHIFFNQGGYSLASGIFTAPRSGVYSLALTVYSDSGSPNSHLRACATLTVNSVPVASLQDTNQQDQEDSSTVVLAHQLTAGDQVSVTLPTDCFLCDDNNHYNTFSGFLLYATD